MGEMSPAIDDPQQQQQQQQQHQQNEDPTSFEIPNPIPYVFPIYWLSVLAWRFVSDLIPSVSRRRRRAVMVLDGIHYGEGPRLRHRHLLYFVDMHQSLLYMFDLRTRRVESTRSFRAHARKISGLGWLPAPDNRLLVVAMDQLKILAVDESKSQSDADAVQEYADVSRFARFRLNDMCVDSSGRAYVGNFGFDMTHMHRLCATTLACVHPPSSSSSTTVSSPGATVAERRMLFPNGAVVTVDGKTLIVAETLRGQLTAFDIDPDTGGLSNRRTWAYLGLPADGICLDARGRVWAAIPNIGLMRARGGAVRVCEGGAIDDIVGFGANDMADGIVACNLFTDDDGTHYLVALTAYSVDDSTIARVGRENAKVRLIQVDCGPAVRTSDDAYHAGYC